MSEQMRCRASATPSGGDPIRSAPEDHFARVVRVARKRPQAGVDELAAVGRVPLELEKMFVSAARPAGPAFSCQSRRTASGARRSDAWYSRARATAQARPSAQPSPGHSSTATGCYGARRELGTPHSGRACYGVT